MHSLINKNANQKGFFIIILWYLLFIIFIAQKRIKGRQMEKSRKKGMCCSSQSIAFSTWLFRVSEWVCAREMVVFGQREKSVFWKELAVDGSHKPNNITSRCVYFSYFIVMTFIAHLVACFYLKRITLNKILHIQCLEMRTRKKRKTKMYRQTMIRFRSRQMPQFRRKYTNTHAFSDLCSPCAFYISPSSKSHAHIC